MKAEITTSSRGGKIAAEIEASIHELKVEFKSGHVKFQKHFVESDSAIAELTISVLGSLLSIYIIKIIERINRTLAKHSGDKDATEISIRIIHKDTKTVFNIPAEEKECIEHFESWERKIIVNGAENIAKKSSKRSINENKFLAYWLTPLVILLQPLVISLVGLIYLNYESCRNVKISIFKNVYYNESFWDHPLLYVPLNIVNMGSKTIIIDKIKGSFDVFYVNLNDTTNHGFTEHGKLIDFRTLHGTIAFNRSYFKHYYNYPVQITPNDTIEVVIPMVVGNDLKLELVRDDGTVNPEKAISLAEFNLNCYVDGILGFDLNSVKCKSSAMISSYYALFEIAKMRKIDDPSW